MRLGLVVVLDVYRITTGFTRVCKMGTAAELFQFSNKAFKCIRKLISSSRSTKLTYSDIFRLNSDTY